MGPRESPRPTLLLSLAPEIPGDFTITLEELHQFQAEPASDPFILGRTTSFFTAGSGVHAADHDLPDEAGSVAMPVEAMTPSEHETAVRARHRPTV
jgi:hypothetical protein